MSLETQSPNFQPRRPTRKPGTVRQQITRVPDFWPEDWVKLKPIPHGEANADLSGKVLQVKSHTASRTDPAQVAAVWRVHFADGRAVLVDYVERHATEAEIRQAERSSRRF